MSNPLFTADFAIAVGVYVALTSAFVTAANFAYELASEGPTNPRRAMACALKRTPPTLHHGFWIGLVTIGVGVLAFGFAEMAPDPRLPLAAATIIFSISVYIGLALVAWSSIRPGINLTPRMLAVALALGIPAGVLLAASPQAPATDPTFVAAQALLVLVLPLTATQARPDPKAPYNWAQERPCVW